ncbi:[NU+] prion formation protein 1 [Talaromyces islandicus]|uniref:[NU+] prion formation protein 1 n=1 Tax=Talaromyces islandicus TaxID=28573 RepID=A0A0U1M621_TALIS|nr:[NU+] prion formation protein 1 [Talaromyces islandicus]
MMKSVFAFSLFATAALSQSANIGLPQNGAEWTAGSNQTVQVQRPDTLTGSNEIAVVIGISPCHDGKCTSPSASMGTVLYQGGFDPEFHNGVQPPYQNFTVEIPNEISGLAMLGVAHFSLVGASASPTMQYLNQTVTVAPSDGRMVGESEFAAGLEQRSRYLATLNIIIGDSLEYFQETHRPNVSLAEPRCVARAGATCSVPQPAKRQASIVVHPLQKSEAEMRPWTAMWLLHSPWPFIVLYIPSLHPFAEWEKGHPAFPNDARKSRPAREASVVIKDLVPDISQLPQSFGRIGLENTEMTYVEGSHWTAILDNIAELKGYFDDTDAPETAHTVDNHSMGQGPRFQHSGPALILGNFQRIDRSRIIATIPPRPRADRLVAKYFSSRNVNSLLIHGPTFLDEYHQFWESPQNTSTMWIGLLFAIMCLGASTEKLETPLSSSSASDILDMELLNTIQTYRVRTAQCLALADYTKCVPYTVEALSHYLSIEYLNTTDGQTGTWILMGIVVQIAVRMGYHRDGSHSPRLSPFQSEMRRRAWAVLFQIDSAAAGQYGLPRMINDLQADTKEPRDVNDDALSRDMPELPQARTDSEPSNIQFLVMKNRLMSTFNMIIDLTGSPRKAASYDEILKLDKILEEQFHTMPASLRMRPEGRRLYHEKWKYYALVNHIWLLATTILCADLDNSLGEIRSRSQYEGDLSNRTVRALKKSYYIWLESSDMSRDAQKAVEMLRVVLNKVPKSLPQTENLPPASVSGASNDSAFFSIDFSPVTYSQTQITNSPIIRSNLGDGLSFTTPRGSSEGINTLNQGMWDFSDWIGQSTMDDILTQSKGWPGLDLQ